MGAIYKNGLRLFLVCSCMCLAQLAWGQECNCSDTLGLDLGTFDADKLEVSPGDTICIAAGQRTHLALINFEGTPDDPLVFINCGGLVEIENDFLGYGLSIDNSRYFKLTGTGDPAYDYGIKINGTQPGANGLTIGTLSTDFEIEFVEVANAGFAGIMAKTDPPCDKSANQGNFYLRNARIHDNFIHDVNGEGLYIGNSFYGGWNTTCDGQEVTLYPHDLIGLRVYNNLIENSGWDGIQIGCASEDTEIYGNTVDGYGLTGDQAHTNGIQIGGGTTGKVYNNVIKDGTGNGIIALGLGNNYIFNNLIIRPGGYGAFCDSRVTIEGSEIAFVNNTIIEPVKGGILNYSKITDNLYYNNIISGGNGSIESIGEIVGNLLNISLLDAILGISLYFVDAETDNYHLKALSPAIDAGTNVSDFDIPFDHDRLERPVQGNYDAGAFEYNASDTVSDLDLYVYSEYVNCNGESNGQIHVEGNGGVPPYSYSWSSGETSQTLDDLPPGDYEITVTDAENASVSRSVEVREPAPLSMEYSVNDVSCFGMSDGAIALNIEGGSPPYQFEWSTGVSAQNLTGLGRGSYSVTVTDRNNCTMISEDFLVTEPDSPLEASYEVKQVTCRGANDGGIILDVKGGVPPYQYSWSTGDSTQSLQNISPQTYAVEISDQNKCTINIDIPVDQRLGICQPVVVYPNPFEDQITVEFRDTPLVPVTFYLTDVSGKQHLNTQSSPDNGESIFTIDLAGLSLSYGMYIMTVETTVSSQSFKLLNFPLD